MQYPSRRDFIKLVGLTTAAGALPLSELTAAERGAAGRGALPFELGMASFTFRSFTLDQAIEMTKRLGLTRIALKEMHLPLNSTEEEITMALAKLKNAGLKLSSLGVVYMKTEEEVRKAFTYAGLAGITMMVGVPDLPLLELAESKVKETGIALAIHNHGPSRRPFPSPESAYKLIEKMDKRMGLCIDVGHTQRLGLDPAVEIERFFDRLLDIHIKDVSSADANGSTVEIGRGVIDVPKLLKMLLRLKYSRTIHLEYEKDQKDPLPGAAESVGYVRGILAT